MSQQPHQLSHEEEEEIRKAFNVADRGGTGFISRQELEQVLRALNPTPSAVISHVQLTQLMNLLDQDHDNRISWPEFKAGLSAWLAQQQNEDDVIPGDNGEPRSATSSGTSSAGSSSASVDVVTALSSPLGAVPVAAARGRKRKQSRTEIHAKISKFFLQFQRSSKFDEVRKQLEVILETKRIAPGTGYQSLVWSAAAVMDSVQAMRRTQQLETIQNVLALNVPNRVETVIMQQQETAATEEARTALITALNTCADGLRSLLSIFPTSTEQAAVADELVILFAPFCRVSVLKRLANLCGPKYFPSVRLAAMNLVHCLLVGPTIDGRVTDTFHILRTEHQFFCTQLFNLGAMNNIYQGLYLPMESNRRQALLCLGTFAEKSLENRDLLLHNLRLVFSETHILLPLLDKIPSVFEGCLQGMTQVADSIEQRENVLSLRTAVWVLQVLCSYLPAPPELIDVSFPIVCELLVKFGYRWWDEATLRYLLKTLELVYPGQREENVPRKLFELLGNPAFTNVHIDVLETCESIARLDMVFVEDLVKCGAVDRLNRLLGVPQSEQLVASAMSLLVLLAHKRVESVSTNEPILRQMIDVLKHIPAHRLQAAKVLRSATRSENPEAVDMLVRNDAISALCASLQHFRVQDNVLQSIYKYGEYSFQFDLVRIVLHALNNIVLEGSEKIRNERTDNEDEEADAAHAEELNPYVLLFKQPDVLHIITLLRTIKSVPQQKLEAWRLASNSKHSHIEEDAQKLLIDIQSVATVYHKRTPNQDVRRICDEIALVLGEFYVGQQLRNMRGAIAVRDQQHQEALARNRQLQLQLQEAVQYAQFNPKYQLVDLSRRLQSPQEKMQLLAEAARVFNMNELDNLIEFFKNQADQATGTISKEQFGQGMVGIMKLTDNNLLADLWRAFDTDNDGRLSFQEFLTGLNQSLATAYSVQKFLERAFTILDADKSGTISRQEFAQGVRTIVINTGRILDAHTEGKLLQAIEQNFAEIDVNNDGQISAYEFRAAWNKNEFLLNVLKEMHKLSSQTKQLF